MAELFHISLSRSSAIAASSGGRGINCHILHRGVPPDQPRRNGRGRSGGDVVTGRVPWRGWRLQERPVALGRDREGGRDGGLYNDD